MAALGSDRFLIGAAIEDTGAEDAGSAYLFSASKSWLATFRNPTPEFADNFGRSVAAIGSDAVLIGAPGDLANGVAPGKVFLFSTNSTLITAFTNPAPLSSKQFGWTVSAFGADRVLSGAPFGGAGVAFMFSTNGALLATFNNPTPASGDGFGNSMVALGGDRVFVASYFDGIGASGAGVVHVFDTNGTLVSTITNPAPRFQGQFGNIVQAFGTDRLIIGANRNHPTVQYAGSAYLYSSAGALLATFTNPAPAAIDFFGTSVAAVGNDRILVSAAERGMAYLFNTNGALVYSFTNPTPDGNEQFASALAALGANRVVIGARYAWNGSGFGGEAYLFDLGTYTTGLVAEAVRPSAVGNSSLLDGSVSATKFDSSIGVWTRSGTNVFRLDGRVGIGTNAPASVLHVVGTVTATAFNPPSDRNLKENFAAVSSREVLEKVAGLSISRWNFKGDSATPHIGPMAQDFYSAFSLGTDDRHIATVDADGVALAAIQGLNQKVEEKNAKIAALEARLEKLERMLEAKGGAR